MTVGTGHGILYLSKEIFSVTIDDLFKENMSSYRNRAQRLLAAFEQTHNMEDFIHADREYRKLMETEQSATERPSKPRGKEFFVGIQKRAYLMPRMKLLCANN